MLSFEDRARQFLARVEKSVDYYRCFDCFTLFSVYMVHDHVWNQAWPSHIEDGRVLEEIHKSMKKDQEKTRCLLCLPCLQERLDRHVQIEDFELTPPVNANIFFAYAMGRRVALGG